MLRQLALMWREYPLIHVAVFATLTCWALALILWALGVR